MISNFVQEWWFPVPVWSCQIDHDFSHVTNKLLSLPLTDPGVHKSHIGGYQSNSILTNEDVDIQDMLNVIRCVGMEIIKKLDPVDGVNFELRNTWVNINYDRAVHVPHTHPLSSFSGVLYLMAPENCGDIVFKRNDLQIHYLPGVFKNLPSQVCYTPQANQLLMFPSWMEHFVEPNCSGHIRLSVAFNTFVWKD